MAHTQYLHSTLELKYRQKAIDFIIETISHIDCDAIVCSGMSGALIAPIVSYITNRNIIVVRKSNDNSHSDLRVEASSVKCKKYVIIDDRIESGRTVRYITAIMSNDNTFKNSKCVGIIIYNSKRASGRYLSGKNNSVDNIPVYSR